MAGLFIFQGRKLRPSHESPNDISEFIISSCNSFLSLPWLSMMAKMNTNCHYAIQCLFGLAWAYFFILTFLFSLHFIPNINICLFGWGFFSYQLLHMVSTLSFLFWVLSTLNIFGYTSSPKLCSQAGITWHLFGRNADSCQQILASYSLFHPHILRI